MTSVRNSFDEALLDTLCEVVWVKDKSELTEDFLWDWVTKTVESFKNRQLPNIEELFKRELSMEENQGDVEAQVTNYFHACNMLIRTNGLVSLFKTEDGTKKKCKILVNGLPARLKKKVKNEIDFRAPEAKSNVPVLFNLIMEQALDDAKIEGAVRSENGKRNQGAANNPARNNVNKQKGFSAPKPQYLGKRTRTDRIQQQVSAPKPQYLDSGAYKSCISRGDVEKLEGTDVEIVKLHQPVSCDLVGGQSLEVKEVVYLKLSLRTAAGPVNIHTPVECLIVEGDDDFLLGQDVLSMLGIDVDRQLELLAWSDGADDDDIVEDPAVSRKDEDEIKQAVELMISRALDEGFPSDRVEQLRTAIFMYDIWRVKLGDDPPAKVPPLKVRLKPGAKPYKTKARKYSPDLQHFLEEFNDTLVSLGWVYENPNARWACPALPVKKAGGANEYRQTTDYKPLNAQVEPLVGTMPNLDVD
ncbi:hypothetical protein PHMEG_00011539 [Phytophthora megakarya]|uniref:Reverse transcriptase n=1 Tax=Phytophthora megakarya TaxID=4795 RepID=A0A225WBA4_9STRA|nr:hypothetical protein PHMEG_00011539 [Phytophthora megakarya]